jgi:DNA-binding transcriptional LysR family regulator
MPAPRLSWDDLATVLAIGRARSLSGAARALGVNHATVFRRLKAMEEGIGVALFERHPDGYVPTPAGEEAIAVATEIDERVTTLERRIVGHDLKPSGTVRVTTVEAILDGLMPGIVVSFRAKHPEIELELVVTPSVVNLSKRDADVALRVTSDPPEALVGRRVASVAVAPYAATAYLDRAGRGRDLAAHDWIGFDETLSHLKSAARLARLLGERTPCLRANSIPTIRNLVVAGIGAGYLPCFFADRVPGLERLADPSPDLASDLWLLTHPDLRQVARVRAVMDHFAAELSAAKGLIEGRG